MKIEILRVYRDGVLMPPGSYELRGEWPLELRFVGSTPTIREPEVAVEAAVDGLLTRWLSPRAK